MMEVGRRTLGRKWKGERHREGRRWKMEEEEGLGRSQTEVSWPTPSTSMPSQPQTAQHTSRKLSVNELGRAEHNGYMLNPTVEQNEQSTWKRGKLSDPSLMILTKRTTKCCLFLKPLSGVGWRQRLGKQPASPV
ncbi:hypothetical protein BO85DRAFT_299342 [Aspergillus piperis CBS 112811]|uniref:Uncharacterized protein n=1 Tax=Aspergillus piperis CBS 112811 TaxID=1448313 RepID=A0A8G1VN64_9EURO|nr:hypothetical protein BO85DRAFT_299342 [Aspergillus piperis CBS 112811]RAH58252.1 hypothetical protein BO85DRAFT_299342 [Aspergillus piperis CBS 112811]